MRIAITRHTGETAPPTSAGKNRTRPYAQAGLFFAVLGLCCGLPASAHAHQRTDTLQLHGFLSQGYLDSMANNFLADSRTGTLQFTELGLNANYSPLENLRAGAQVFARDVGQYCNYAPKLDWALIDYRPYDQFGIRLGKVKLPMGLYNESRDSDFLRPMIFLPQSIYDETRRDIYLAYMGGGFYGNLAMGRTGDLDYKIFGGRMRFPSESVLEDSTERQIRSIIADNNASATPDPNIPSQFSSMERDNEEIYGAAFVLNTSLHGLRLGGSWMHSENDLQVNGISTPAGHTEMHSKIVVSAEYLRDHFFMAAEYSETDRTQTIYSSTTLDGTAMGWYVLFGYTPFEKLTFTAMYDEYYRLKNDKEGRTVSASSPTYSAWRKDIALGLRYDFSESWNAKAEYHWLDGAALQLDFFNPEGTARYWNYFAARISYTF